MYTQLSPFYPEYHSCEKRHQALFQLLRGSGVEAIKWDFLKHELTSHPKCCRFYFHPKEPIIAAPMEFAMGGFGGEVKIM